MGVLNKRGSVEFWTAFYKQSDTKNGTKNPNKFKWNGVLEIRRNKWRAEIKIDGVNVHLGTFRTQEGANIIYQNKVKRIKYGIK